MTLEKGTKIESFVRYHFIRMYHSNCVMLHATDFVALYAAVCNMRKSLKSLL